MSAEARSRLTDLFNLPAAERQPLAWSFACFFSILCAYFLLRPIRDEMAIVAGPENIPDLFLGTFVLVLLTVPAFGWVTKRLPRRVFLPGIFAFFIVNLLLFFWIFGIGSIDRVWPARAFFVWLSVFNMFIVALFWSFMVDLYEEDQARRLFGYIAAGGSVGAILGPTLTAALVGELGLRMLFLLAAGLLCVALVCVVRLLAWARANARPERPVNDTRPLGGAVLDGVRLVFSDGYLGKLAALMLVGTFCGTALYLYQAELLSGYSSDSTSRTRLLAGMDIAINTLTLALNLFVARAAFRRFGVGRVLLLLPVLTLAGLIVLIVAPGVTVIVVLQVLRRGLNFGLNVPAKETIYTVVSPDAKYKAKNFIDVSLVRGADVLSSQTVRLMQTLAGAFAPVAVFCAPHTTDSATQKTATGAKAP
ncbi:MAG: MFS transporter, partial [Pseudomonadota bacterium]